MSRLVVINGAPGSGKTTITKLLHEHFQSVMIDFGWLREFHLDPEWKNASPEEEAMSFENLVFILRNYLKHNYQYVLVNDLEDYRIQQLPMLFETGQFVIITLIINEDQELQRRVLTPDRDSGFRDFTTAIAWNRALRDRPLLPNEYRFDNTDVTPEAAYRKIVNLLDTHMNGSSSGARRP